MTSTRDEQGDVAIDFLWKWFRSEGRWPSRKDFLLHMIDAGSTVASLRGCSEISLGVGGSEEVRPTFTALVALPEVREFLAPIPRVLRQAAAVFVAQAVRLPDNRLPALHFREVKGYWSDAASAKIAFDVLRGTGAGLFDGGGSSGTDPEDFWFSLSIDILRYEHVQTLDDVLQESRYPEVKEAGRFPSGKHLDLLRRIYAASKAEQRWPRALEFAVSMRDVGHVPQLVRELHSRFIRGDFQASQHHALALKIDALPFVDPSGEDRTLLLKAVGGIVEIWRGQSGSVEIPLTELAAALRVRPAELGPVVALLEWSKWCNLGHVNESHLHLVVVPGDPELVLRNMGLTTFDEYMNTWDEGREPYTEMFSGSVSPSRNGNDQGNTPPVPELPVAFIKSDAYRRVIEADLQELRRTVAARAWKSSLILVGGIIEGALLDVLFRRDAISSSVLRKELSRASLMDLIEASVKLDLVQPSVTPFARVAKDYRDLTHPFRSGASPLRPAEESVRAMLHALEIVLKDLDAAARDGRLARFELTT